MTVSSLEFKLRLPTYFPKKNLRFTIRTDDIMMLLVLQGESYHIKEAPGPLDGFVFSHIHH
jgi:hypothetical protein